MLSSGEPKADASGDRLSKLVTVFCEKAQMLEQQGKLTDALSQYANAINAAGRIASPLLSSLHLSRVKIYIKLNKIFDAERELELAMNQNSQDPEIALVEANLMALQRAFFIETHTNKILDQKNQEEKTCLNTADLRSSLDLTFNAFAALCTGKYEAALDHTTQANKLIPTAINYMIRGKTCMALKKFELARESLALGIKISNLPYFHFLLAHALAALKLYQKAYQAFVIAMTVSEIDHSTFSFDDRTLQEALYACEQHKINEALIKAKVPTDDKIQALNTLLLSKKNSLDAEAYYQRGLRYLELRALSEAQTDFSFCLWLASNSGKKTSDRLFLYYLARRKTHLLLGEFQKSLDDNQNYIVIMRTMNDETAKWLDPESKKKWISNGNNATFLPFILMKSKLIYASEWLEKADECFARKKYGTSLIAYSHATYLIDRTLGGKLNLNAEFVSRIENKDKMTAFVASLSNNELRSYCIQHLAQLANLRPQKEKIEQTVSEEKTSDEIRDTLHLVSSQFAEAELIEDKILANKCIATLTTLIDQANTTDPSLQAGLYSLRGKSHYLIEENKAARADLDRAITLDATLSSHLYRALTLRKLNNLHEAREDLLQCMTLDYKGYGLILKNNILLQEWRAIEATLADPLLQSQTMSTEAYFARSEIYEKSGRWQEAINDQTAAIWMRITFNDRTCNLPISALFFRRMTNHLLHGDYLHAIFDRDQLIDQMHSLSDEAFHALEWVKAEIARHNPYFHWKKADLKRKIPKIIAVHFSDIAQTSSLQCEAESAEDCLDYLKAALLSLYDIYTDYLKTNHSALINWLDDENATATFIKEHDSATVSARIQELRTIVTTLNTMFIAGTRTQEPNQFQKNPPREHKPVPQKIKPATVEMDDTPLQPTAIIDLAALRTKQRNERLRKSFQKQEETRIKRREKREKEHQDKIARLEAAAAKNIPPQQVAQEQKIIDRTLHYQKINERIQEEVAAIEARLASRHMNSVSKLSIATTIGTLSSDEEERGSPDSLLSSDEKTDESVDTLQYFEVPASENRVGKIPQCAYLTRLNAVQKKQGKNGLSFLGGGLIRNHMKGIQQSTDVDIFTDNAEEDIREAFPVSSSSDVQRIDKYTDTFGELFVIRFKDASKIEIVRSFALIEASGTAAEKVYALVMSLDFTMNALLLTEEGKLYCLLPSILEDIKHNRLVTLSPVRESFFHFPLRILRGLDFNTRFDMKIAETNPEMALAIQDFAPLILLKEMPVKVNILLQKIMTQGFALANYQSLKKFHVLEHLLGLAEMNFSVDWLEGRLKSADDRFKNQEKTSINRIYMWLAISSLAVSFQGSTIDIHKIRDHIERNILLKINFQNCSYTDSLITDVLASYRNPAISLPTNKPLTGYLGQTIWAESKVNESAGIQAEMNNTSPMTPSNHYSKQ